MSVENRAPYPLPPNGANPNTAESMVETAHRTHVCQRVALLFELIVQFEWSDLSFHLRLNAISCNLQHGESMRWDVWSRPSIWCRRPVTSSVNRGHSRQQLVGTASEEVRMGRYACRCSRAAI
jgi:hypothetical protein